MSQSDTNSKSPAKTISLSRLSAPGWLLALFLALVTVILYWPVTHCDFINFDDNLYIFANSHVVHGLTWEDFKWAFITPVASNWHPITMLSHMMDCQLYGLNPMGPHLENVLLHAANAALVFVLLQYLTGARWRSLLVAAFFAVHPLHVESVAWVSERKDVLSTFFGLLGLIFYARYAKVESKKQKAESRNPDSDGGAGRKAESGNYLVCLLFLALGLMCKPMLVTWPFVMLLLDYWPLGRFKQLGAWRLAKEKTPFFILAAAASVATLIVQKSTGAVVLTNHLPFWARCGNAVVSYCTYLGKLFWPTDLAVYYPYHNYLLIWKMAIAVMIL